MLEFFRLDAAFEYGLTPSLNLKLNEMLILRAKQNVEVYQNLDDFVNDATSKFSSKVQLYNVKNLFFSFGGFFTLVSLWFILDILVFHMNRHLQAKIMQMYFGDWLFPKVAINSKPENVK